MRTRHLSNLVSCRLCGCFRCVYILAISARVPNVEEGKAFAIIGALAPASGLRQLMQACGSDRCCAASEGYRSPLEHCWHGLWQDVLMCSCSLWAGRRADHPILNRSPLP